MPADGGNADTVNSHTASGIPNTTEKTDLVGMVNEVFDGLNGTNTKVSNLSESVAADFADLRRKI